MFARLSNLAIVDLQAKLTKKYGDTVFTANIVREFTAQIKNSGKLSEIDTIKASYISKYQL